MGLEFELLTVLWNMSKVHIAKLICHLYSKLAYGLKAKRD